ncbi:MAG: hypothetical protein KIH63_002145 [Candidatus Saccharibacteria bacterium]|nr:hypothetical protein [Candidatus Saccharibacteria bacterium]
MKTRSKSRPIVAELDPRRTPVRDEGVSTTAAAIVAAAAFVSGIALITQVNGSEAPINTAPGSGGTAAPGEATPTTPGGSSPNSVVTSGGMIDATTPPTAPITTVAAVEKLAHTYNYSVVDSAGVTIDRQLNCANGAPILDLTMLPHPRSGDYSLFYTIDQYFTNMGQATNMLNGNDSIAEAIVGDSGLINPGLDWDAAMAEPGFNIGNLHAPGDPNAPGHVAIATGCLDAKGVTWIPAAA